MLRLMLGTTLLPLAACASAGYPSFDDKGVVDTNGSGGGGGGDTCDTCDTEPHDSDSDTQSGGGGGATETDTDTEEDGFDDPGDHASFDESEGTATIDLADVSGDSNTSQDFYVITVNGDTTSGASFVLHYTDDAAAGPPAPRSHELPVTRTKFAPAKTPLPHARPGKRDILTDADIGVATDTFHVRNNLTDARDYQDWTDATGVLTALGTNVEIWVDNDVPMDWDYDCDGVVDTPYGNGAAETFGFTNCDLSTLADISDYNIIPNVRTLYGSESDIDSDGRVAIFVTPILNQITQTSDDELDHLHVLPSYTEPAVDLTDWDIEDNPGSDEREVIYVYSPDPAGYFNHDAPVDVDSYTNYTFAAEIARGMTALVSYNQHVIVWEDDGDDSTAGSVEDDWVNNVLGTFAAEYCGFGAAYYRTAWDYLDQPWFTPLTENAEGNSLAGFDFGAQYLFGLWLYDWAIATGVDPTSMFNATMQTTDTGTDSIEGGTGESFGDLVLAWQVALLTSGVDTDAGDPLVDDGLLYVPYAELSTISSPPAALDNHYGANGYQQGFDLRGTNQPMTGGTTDTPTAEVGAEIFTTGTDFFHFNPDFTFVGYAAKNYGVQVTRLTGINYDSTSLNIQADNANVIGEVVRWNDPSRTDFVAENVFSASESTSVDLPALPSDGSQLHAIGEITAPVAIDLAAADSADVVETSIYDTDRWVLDLSDRTIGEQVPVTVWLDRQFAESDSTSGPDDPWIAIVPTADLPAPDNSLTDDSTCSGQVAFVYPTDVLPYLYSQQVLTNTIYDSSTTLDYCGAPQPDPVCTTDYDMDGVTDDAEPTPSTFYDQVRTWQCQENANTPPDVPYDTSWLDWEELDTTLEEPIKGYTDGTGGLAGATGMEGYVSAVLTGGESYTIVVAAHGEATGVYELSVKQLEE